MAIETYRDRPKPGETDAGWCGFVSQCGHVMFTATGHAPEEIRHE